MVSDFDEWGGTTWTLGERGALCRLNPETDVFERVVQAPPSASGRYHSLGSGPTGFWLVAASSDSLRFWEVEQSRLLSMAVPRATGRPIPMRAAVDSLGRLWGAAGAAGVLRATIDGVELVSAERLSAYNELYRIDPLSVGGAVWVFGSLGSVAHIGADGHVDQFGPQGDAVPAVSGVARTWSSGSVLHAAMFDGRVLRFDAEARVFLPPLDVSVAGGVDPVRAVAETPSETWVLLNRSGLRTLGGEAPVTEEGRPVDAMGAAFLADRSGALWLGRRGGGIVRLRVRPSGIDSIVRVPGSQLPSALVEDARGAVWIGTGSDLHRVSPDGGVRSYRYLPRDSRSLSTVGQQALHVSDDGSVWVGTSNGLSRYVPASDDFERHLMFSVRDFTAPPPPSPQSERSSAERSGAPLPAATPRPLVARELPVAPGSVRRPGPGASPGGTRERGARAVRRPAASAASRSPRQLSIHAVTSAADGALWIGGEVEGRAFVGRYVPGEDEATFAALSADSAVRVSALNWVNGALWAAMSDPAQVLRYDSSTNSFVAADLSSEAMALLNRSGGVTAIIEANGRPCAVATQGLICRDDGRWMLQSAIPQRYAAGEGAEWLVSRSGLVKRFGDTARSASAFNAYVGGVSNSALLGLRDGRLVLATNRALVYADPSRLDVAVPTAPRFSSVDVHGPRPSRVGPLALAVSQAAMLPSDANAATIRFAGDGPAPDRARFAYRIRGLVDEWVDLDAPELQLAGLPPGRHVVDVRARGDVSDATPEATIALTVLPRLSQTRWFRLLLVALGLALVGGAIAYRESTRRRRERLRRRIADDLHDDLGSRMSALALQQDLIGSRLAADDRAKTDELAERLRTLSRDLRDVVWYVDATADTLPALAARAAAAARSLLPPERLTVAIGQLPRPRSQHGHASTRADDRQGSLAQRPASCV